MRVGRRWSDADRCELIRLRRECGLSWEECAARFPNATLSACRTQFALATSKLPRNRAQRGEARRVDFEETDPIAARVGEGVLAERDHRNALRIGRSDITANFFGDPLPGYSALDQRRPMHVRIAIKPTETLS